MCGVWRMCLIGKFWIVKGCKWDSCVEWKEGGKGEKGGEERKLGGVEVVD